MQPSTTPTPQVSDTVWVFLSQHASEDAWRILLVGLPGESKETVRQQGKQRLPDGWRGLTRVICKRQAERHLLYEWARYEATSRQIEYLLHVASCEQVVAVQHYGRARLCYPCDLLKHQQCEGPVRCDCPICTPVHYGWPRR